MKARFLMLVVIVLGAGAVGLGRASSASRPARGPAAADVGQREVDTFIECTREDPCGPGFVCRGGKCVPKK